MTAFLDTAAEFLQHRRIAVAGLSRDGANPGNHISRRLREHGYDVFAVHPTAAAIDGEPCFRSVAAVPGGVDGVVITTHPDVSPAVIRDCVAAGVHRVWLHRSVGAGSVSAEAVELCERHGIALLDGGCPMMVLRPDVGHRCMRWVLDVTGRLPDGSRFRAAERSRSGAVKEPLS
jgi:uncharacterized protein